ncbi:MAG TPA: DUF1697 domain-containing protein [Myxococcales bacterium]
MATSVYVALLRAVNVGGTGKLPMAELRALCEDAGFTGVSTYIQSGNVVLKSALPEKKVKATLEAALARKMGKPVGVSVRTGAELAAVLKANPFEKAQPNRVIVLFLDEVPAKGALDAVKIPGREQLSLKGRELFIHYPDGQGTSKLKLPLAKDGTGRNLNTVAKLAELARSTER